MLIGVNNKKIWEFANKQTFFLNEVEVISDLTKINKFDIDTLIEIDSRYDILSVNFTGPIFFSHIKNINPISKSAKESLEQLYLMFPEIKILMR